MKIPNGCWTGCPESEQQPKAKAGCHAMKATRPSRGKPLLDGGLHFGEKEHTVRCDEKERKEGIQPWPKGTWPESSVPQKHKVATPKNNPVHHTRLFAPSSAG
jgi:hypothetical protein